MVVNAMRIEGKAESAILRGACIGAGLLLWERVGVVAVLVFVHME